MHPIFKIASFQLSFDDLRNGETGWRALNYWACVTRCLPLIFDHVFGLTVAFQCEANTCQNGGMCTRKIKNIISAIFSRLCYNSSRWLFCEKILREYTLNKTICVCSVEFTGDFCENGMGDMTGHGGGSFYKI